ncbi:polyprenyl synthetase family protein [Brachybacterium huguangmaarense]|uniref:Polyprenyl synthetase family protein n=1 Tax=Brachybacterium huguangmaarense TaxID=1652028 RepID=A0ABY6FYB1_9MICO|nr:polyprenyl synthetase family protein [Brachybacterium huguangmaarense]UYG15825.1 polyprenyl synthetase family protein [Brachybacterium huguangmaarense]
MQAVPDLAETTAPALDESLSAEIAQLMQPGAARMRTHGPEAAELWDEAVAALAGGKRIRPRLLVETYDALAPEGAAPAPRALALRVAATLEILHVALLLHDDVIDGDLTRRGRDNLIGSLHRRTAARDDEHSLHRARSAAILVGDLLLALTHQSLARLPLATARRTSLLDLLDDALCETVAGEFLDVSLADGALDPDVSTVLEMTRSKTAAYSVELPLRWAAVLADADPATGWALARVGRHVGLAYQLQDDALSVFGDAACHGKDPFSDLREGKETAIIAYARTTGAWEGIRRHLGAPDLTEEQALTLQRLLVDCGARRHVEALTAIEMRAARALLADGALPVRARPVLDRLLDRLEDRAA